MTDKKDEALKLALGYMDGTLMTEHLTGYERKRHVMQSIREALAEQPAQQQCPHDFLMGDDEPGHDSVCMQCGAAVPNDEPAQLDPSVGTQVSKVWWDGDKLMAQPIPLEKLYKEPEQPAQQQEPVAWITKNGKGWLRWHKPEDSEKNKDSIPLYTAPTSKPWVGLTQTDLVDCDEEELKQARYWENKLKEKNT